MLLDQSCERVDVGIWSGDVLRGCGELTGALVKLTPPVDGGDGEKAVERDDS